MTMQFGMPTLIEMKSTESCTALCRELGLAFIELNMNLPEYQVENFDVAKEYDCRIVLEVKTVAGLRQLVNWLKERSWL